MSPAVLPLEDWALDSLERDGVVLPAFPMVAVRLVDALEQRDADVDEVCGLLRQDPSITSQVIRIANSVYYGAAAPISDIRGATMRLGLRETANVAMSGACRSLFAMEDRAELEQFPDVWRQLWASALVGAYGARLISLETKLGDPERIFLSALLRDVGSLLLLKVVTSGLVHGRLRREPTREQLGVLLAAHHERLGGAYLRESRLPDYAVEVAEDHHSTLLVVSEKTVGAHIVRVADGLCCSLGVTPFAADPPGMSGETSAEMLGFDEQRLEYFSLQIEALRNELQDMA